MTVMITTTDIATPPTTPTETPNPVGMETALLLLAARGKRDPWGRHTDRAAGGGSY